MNNKEQLASDLFASFEDFQSNAPTPGGSREANLYVASKLADAIWDGIKRGSRLVFKGAKTSEELNGISEKIDGDVYLCTTDGVLEGSVPLDVSANTAVIWDGKSWSKFIEIDLSEYYTKIETDDNLTAAVANEAGLRDAADTALGGRIDAEATARENADATLQVNIDAEETAREDADATLQSNIESEATEREQADGELQAQIDAISSRSDVVDVVASHVELVAYDTSTLADNDVIKVLADETHEDAIAYYRWSTTTEAWSFVGSQGPYYTISETDTLLAGRAPTNHASTSTTYGVGNATKYGHVKVDEALSSSSTNPVQNKAVKAAIDAKTDVKYFMYNAPYADIIAALPSAYQNRKNVFLIGNENGEYPCVYSLLHVDRDNSAIVFVAVDSEYNIKTITKSASMGSGWSSATYSVAPKAHASSATTYGTGTSSNYGHVKLSDSTSSTSGMNGGEAATPSAVKAAYDLANSKYSMPSGGILKNELASDVQTSLGLADTALQPKRTNCDVLSRYFCIARVKLAGGGMSGTFCYYFGLYSGQSCSGVIDVAVRSNSSGTSTYTRRACGVQSTPMPVLLYKDATYVYVILDLGLLSIDSMDGHVSWLSYRMYGAGGDLLPGIGWSSLSGLTLVVWSSYMVGAADVVNRHTNEVNVRAVDGVYDNVQWFNYRNGDTDLKDSANIIAMYAFGNRNGTVDGVVLFANRLRLGTGTNQSGTYGELKFEGSGTSPKLVLQASTDPHLGVFTTEAHSGTSAHGVQLDAESGGNVGLWGYVVGTGGSGWICYKDTNNICSLGKSSDTVVRLGTKKLDFSGTAGSDSNTVYFV